ITHKTDELGRFGAIDPPHGQVDGKPVAIPPLSLQLAAHADDVRDAGTVVTGEVLVMRAAVRLRHQHADIATLDLRRTPAEQALGRSIEGLNETLMINEDYRIDRGVHDGKELIGWHCRAVCYFKGCGRLRTFRRCMGGQPSISS